MSASTCPACLARRLHTPADWEAHHPYARHGYAQGQGWTHPDLAPPPHQPFAYDPEVLP